MATRILERVAFIGGRLFEAGDEIEVSDFSPNVLIPTPSSPIGNLTLDEVAVYLRIKAEEAGKDLNLLVYPDLNDSADFAQDPPVVVTQQPVLVKEGQSTPVEPAPSAPTPAGSATADGNAPDFSAMTKAELVAWLGADSPSPDTTTKAQLIELAEKKAAKPA